MKYTNADGDVLVGKIVAHVIGLIVLLIVVFGSFGSIDAGYQGVKTRFGAVVGTVGSGLYFKLPIIEHVVSMDVQTQKEQVDSVEAASQDLQTVHANVAVNYHLEPEKATTIFKTIGVDYAQRVIDPAIQESVKATTAKYTAEQLITKREEVREGIIVLLSTKLQAFGVNVDALNITNFDFSETFNQAIEAKVTAEQNALAAKNKLDQVKYEADQRIAQADGEAKAIQIQAQAIAAQGGAAYVNLKAVEKWNGVLPTYMMSGGSVPFVNLK